MITPLISFIIGLYWITAIVGVVLATLGVWRSFRRKASSDLPASLPNDTNGESPVDNEWGPSLMSSTIRINSWGLWLHASLCALVLGYVLVQLKNGHPLRLFPLILILEGLTPVVFIRWTFQRYLPPGLLHTLFREGRIYLHPGVASSPTRLPRIMDLVTGASFLLAVMLTWSHTSPGMISVLAVATLTAAICLRLTERLPVMVWFTPDILTWQRVQGQLRRLNGWIIVWVTVCLHLALVICILRAAT